MRCHAEGRGEERLDMPPLTISFGEPSRKPASPAPRNHLVLSAPMVKDRTEPHSVFELPGGLGGLNPPTSSCPPPYLWSKFDTGGVEFQPPHLSFAEVGMLFHSHFLLMQFLKYLQCGDLNVTTILIHIED